jgi:glutamate--cysteine ligase
MDETIFLSSLEEIVASGVTPAEVMLREYETVWHGDVRPAFREYAF